jgi:xylulokinase
LSGERSPHADPDARGAFIGLTLRHTKAHMTRAVVEGITFGLLDSLNLARQIAGKPIRSVRISGGGAKAPGWRQIMADIFGAEVVTVNATQGAAFGAALLAGVGAGSFTTVRDACAKVVRETSRTSPGPQAGNYPKFYKRYRALYPALRGEFKAI